MKKLISIGLACVVLLGLLCGCGSTKDKSLDQQIIGSWEQESYEWAEGSKGDFRFFLELNFYDDNTADFGSNNDANFAHWDIVNNEILKFTYNDTLSSDYSGTDKWTVTIDADTMTLTSDDGSYAVYSRTE